jgi:hypothetical protein
MAQVTVGINDNTKVEYRAFDTNELFSSKYHAKTTYSADGNECVFCGRNTSKQGNASGVMVGAGGALIIHPEDYDLAIDGGEMGWWPVGSECIKSVPAEFRVNN